MSYSMSRRYTSKLLEMMDEGLLTPEQVANMCLAYMSEDDVKGMVRYNDILQDVEKEISVDLTIEQINALDL